MKGNEKIMVGKKRILLSCTAALTALSLGCGLSGCGKQAEKTGSDTAGFTPRLDTEASVTLELGGFMGNFEALNEVINDFNEIYPNVSLSYEQNSVYMLRDYLNNNTGVDLFMTAAKNLYDKDTSEDYVADCCVDLSKEDIDLSAIDASLLSYGTVDGALVQVPLTRTVYGMAVNKTLLKEEGIEVPETYKQFLDALSALSDKGYTPVMASENHVYAELAAGMAMNLIEEGKGEAEAALPAFERLESLLPYTDPALNGEMSSDNYDASIMRFFEGDIPFWVCGTESFSGTKKRESKSETYSASSFEYEFMEVPLGDDGVYSYAEPWYGFSVNKESDNLEYALEFIRFLAQPEELDELASIKGMPTVTSGESPRYPSLGTQKTSGSFINDGSIPFGTEEALKNALTGLGTGEYGSAEEAAAAFSASLH